jgi:2-haloalkanoic acid dehalogenase type II
MFKDRKVVVVTGSSQGLGEAFVKAAEAVGLRRDLAQDLGDRYAELRPWPAVPESLLALEAANVPMGIVTNCSERLAGIAASCVGVRFNVLVTAERAAFYKPDPRPYLLALRELGVEPARCLFVAGSAYDLVGTARVGLPTYWHDRVGMTAPEGAPAPLAHQASLDFLLPLVGKADRDRTIGS